MIKQFIFLLFVIIINTANAQVDTAKSIESLKISFDLKGRSILKFPPKTTDPNQKGIVVFQIVVSANGTVLNAAPDYANTTTTSPILIAKGRQAALQTKFNAIHGVAEQKGTITIGISLEP